MKPNFRLLSIFSVIIVCSALINTVSGQKNSSEWPATPAKKELNGMIYFDKL